MKKRIVCVLLIISLVSMMFVGCSSKTERNTVAIKAQFA